MLFEKKPKGKDIADFFVHYKTWKNNFGGIVCFAVLSILVFQSLYSFSTRIELISWLFFNLLTVLRATFNYVYVDPYEKFSSGLFYISQLHYITYTNKRSFKIYFFSPVKLIKILKLFDTVLEKKNQQFQLNPSSEILLSSAEKNLLKKTSELIQKFENHFFSLALKYFTYLSLIFFVFLLVCRLVWSIYPALASYFGWNNQGFSFSNVISVFLELGYFFVKLGSTGGFYLQLQTSVMDYYQLTIKGSTHICIFWSDIAEESIVSIVEECILLETC